MWFNSLSCVVKRSVQNSVMRWFYLSLQPRLFWWGLSLTSKPNIQHPQFFFITYQKDLPNILPTFLKNIVRKVISSHEDYSIIVFFVEFYHLSAQATGRLLLNGSSSEEDKLFKVFIYLNLYFYVIIILVIT